ncbi:MAG: hypothetical protein HQ474_07130 [Flammeovirgaceae bacterium]|nr:hypothetical protein [Flammeovirgaceae bacterium]
MQLVSKEIKAVIPFYGSDQYVDILEGYHQAFDSIQYHADVWVSATSDKGSFDGSVRTYGKWTGIISTGKQLNLHGYWYFNCDTNALLIEQGNFFDATGMMQAVYNVNHADELINMVEMTSSDKTETEIVAFSAYYQSLMNKLEPNVLSWKFFKFRPIKIILIERYKNKPAILNHIKNISQEGILEKYFGSFLAHFTVEKMTLYGECLNELFIKMGFSNQYIPLIAGYSK